jgi:hypothetical protein
MATFILATRLSADVMAGTKGRDKIGRAWLEHIHDR